MKKIGFIGLGNMGQGMAKNLLDKGAEITVYTRNSEKIKNMENLGAKGAYSLEELTSNSEINYLLKKKKIKFLDAPVSGGTIGAENASLAIMVGGNQEAYNIALPFLKMMGTTVKYMGNSGTGTAMKLINQLLTAVHTTAAAEALALTNATEIDIDSAMEILMVSFGFSRMLERSAPIIKDRKFIGSSVPARNIHKDINIIDQLGKELSVNLPLIEASKSLYDELKNEGKEMDDMAGIIQIIEKRSGE